ncbi:putative DNA mismatch repair protein [Aspergillus neoniger CBS 115656]|uniref:DNA mismatch repair protein n=1 Tax=Aspergillus neoniger (strain CBS 115656) TaxID=1448310 RepID=A0A318YUQ1_ASPNB|nr:DNA mismatch repair protein [Aspergillus neoniger CBS 115656]PYH38119.1 DNA mismatch repair protein [Aspergillus neoniger CBS 115656]
MPIAALSPAAVRAIGSASVISDPCSIVKELLDNALDATATSVSIEISQNTLDVVQVKDNGHGIPASDHSFVCKRTFTSKIQSVEDLRTIGGKSLGFRGEALASAAEVSSGVAITTRVPHEPVGSSIKYGRNGELLSTQRASHPVGTSVRITDLFKHIPVRRQTTIKNAAKTLVRIKKLVQAYAIAQPSKRLSLRVLRAKTETNNWIYAPGNNTSLVDAVLKVVGTEVSSSCLVKAWPPENDSDRSFRIVALLPRPMSDLTKVNGSGQYISIDGRPLSTSRGVAQNIAKLFKSYIRSLASSQEPSPSITDPLLCLQLQCTNASYDVNIEPAKDDVLLEDREKLLSLVEELLCDVYGIEAKPAERSRNVNKEKEPAPYRNSFDILLASKSPDDSRASSYASSTPRTPAVEGQHSAHTENRLELRSASSNPWSIPKESMPMPTRDISSSRSHTDKTGRCGIVRDPTESRGNLRERLQTSSPGFILPSPSASSTTAPGYVTEAQSSPSSPGTPQTPLPRTRQASMDHGTHPENGALDSWLRKTPVPLSQPNIGEVPVDDGDERSLQQLAQERFGSPERSPSGSASIENGVATAQNQCPETQASPAEADAEPEETGSPLLGSTTDPKIREDHAPAPEKSSATLRQLLSGNNHQELDRALDFENRKREAILRHREQLRSRRNQTTTSSPHMSRYLAAKAALHSQPDADREDEPTVKPVLSPHDPRSRLMRHRAQDQYEDGISRIRRINTDKLPLENIPDENELYSLGLTQQADIPLISTTYDHITKTDLYTGCGDQFVAFDHSHKDTERVFDIWRYRLTSLMQGNYQTKERSGIPDVHFNFSRLAQRGQSK